MTSDAVLVGSAATAALGPEGPQFHQMQVEHKQFIEEANLAREAKAKQRARNGKKKSQLHPIQITLSTEKPLAESFDSGTESDSSAIKMVSGTSRQPKKREKRALDDDANATDSCDFLGKHVIEGCTAQHILEYYSKGRRGSDSCRDFASKRDMRAGSRKIHPSSYSQSNSSKNTRARTKEFNERRKNKSHQQHQEGAGLF